MQSEIDRKIAQLEEYLRALKLAKRIMELDLTSGPPAGSSPKNSIGAASSRRDAVASYIRANGPAFRHEIQKALRIPLGTLSYVLSHHKDTFSRTSDGRWELVDLGPSGEREPEQQATTSESSSPNPLSHLPMPEAVMLCLQASPNPLSTREIMNELEKAGRTASSFPQQVYNTLYRLTNKGKLIRDGARWFPAKRLETPNQQLVEGLIEAARLTGT